MEDTATEAHAPPSQLSKSQDLGHLRGGRPESTKEAAVMNFYCFFTKRQHFGGYITSWTIIDDVLRARARARGARGRARDVVVPGVVQ